MQNELRFRAWHKKEKIYLSDERLLDADRVPVIPNSYGFRLDDKLVKFEQWTGLMDIHRTRIFVGDIVRGSWDRTLQPMVVLFQAPEFIMKTQPKNRTWSQFNLHFSEPQNYEIIGNINQHPQLLTKGVRSKV